jgi:hypothetical protein
LLGWVRFGANLGVQHPHPAADVGFLLFPPHLPTAANVGHHISW